MATFIQNQFSRPFHAAIDTRTSEQNATHVSFTVGIEDATPILPLPFLEGEEPVKQDLRVPVESISPISRIARISRHCPPPSSSSSLPIPSLLSSSSSSSSGRTSARTEENPVTSWLCRVCAPWYRKKRPVRFSITTVHAGGYADRKEERKRKRERGGVEKRRVQAILEIRRRRRETV